jgi:colanic acid biosynthesis glycosyl transferase WcaI
VECIAQVPLNERVRSITLWGINYAPEKTGIGPQTVWLAEGLRDRGFDVTVICAFTYYPAWMKNPEDKGKLYRTETIRGVRVQRNWLYVPRKLNLVKRTLQQASFMVLSSLRVLFAKPSDLYVVISPPFLLSPAMRLISALKSRPFVMHLQDDEVSAAFETTGLGSSCYRILKSIEIWGHSGACMLSTISQGMEDRLRRQLDSSSLAISLLSNRVGQMPAVELETIRTLREKLGARRLLVYTGNLGDKQVLDDLIPAIARYSPKEIIFYICGMGAQRSHLAELIEAEGDKADNIVFGELLPDDEFAALLASADACVLSEKTHRGRWLSPGICFASKMLSYLRQGKPLFVYADGESEVGQIVQNQKCGFALGDFGNLNAMLDAFLEASGSQLEEMGLRGKAFYHDFVQSHDLDAWLESVKHCLLKNP